MCGDTIGNITPLGPLVGEPAKAAFVRGRVALGPALTALAIENVLYTLSAAAMIAAGMVALLVSFQMPSAIRGVGELAVGGTLVLFGLALWMLWRQPALISRALGLAPPTRRHAERIQEIETRIYTFASRHRGRLPLLARGDRLPRARRRGKLPDALDAPGRGAAAPHRVHPRNRQPVDHGRVQVHPDATLA